MSRFAIRQVIRTLLLYVLVSPVAFASTVTGTITNGTTGKPAVGVDIILFQLQGGMQQAATTKTDSSGHYKIDSPLLGAAPMLLRAIYRGVNYHEPVTPGKTSIDIQVFEPTDKPNAFAVTAHAIILQPSGSNLSVGEEYDIQNSTQPPMAYFRADGSFLFSLPDAAQLNDVSAVGGSGMPVVEHPIDKGKGTQAIDFPFRPGGSGVRISYHLPYTNDQANLRFSSPYHVDRLAIFAPPSVTVSGDGFSPAGQDQGFNVYMRESVAASTPISVAISGTGPAPQDSGASGDESQNPSVNSRADSGSAAPVASVTTIPARLDSLKWVLLGGFAAVFALGLAFLWRQPAGVSAPGAIPAASVPIPVASTPAPSDTMPAHPTLQNQVAPSSSVAAATVEREVHASLDELKDALFRLELRHEAGTIAPEDYARERERIQKVLRDLVKG